MAMQRAIAALAELREQGSIHLSLRVGVNTGEVIVASVGDQRTYSEDTAMGGAIALAARMEQAAEPGRCWSVQYLPPGRHNSTGNPSVRSRSRV